MFEIQPVEDNAIIGAKFFKRKYFQYAMTFYKLYTNMILYGTLGH
jgi:hypothetical protein